jgi:hypothetical protein
MNIISMNHKGVMINIGEYNFSYINLNSKSILVERMILNYCGDVDIDNISTYPKIIANSTVDVNDLSIFDIVDTTATFQYVQLFFSSNAHSSLNYFYCFNLYLYV